MGRAIRPRLARWRSTAAIATAVIITMVRPVDGTWRSKGVRVGALRECSSLSRVGVAFVTTYRDAG